MQVSVVVRDGDETCWPCKLLRLALISMLLRPQVCLRCCDEIVALLTRHTRFGHAPPRERREPPGPFTCCDPAEAAAR